MSGVDAPSPLRYLLGLAMMLLGVVCMAVVWWRARTCALNPIDARVDARTHAAPRTAHTRLSTGVPARVLCDQEAGLGAKDVAVGMR